MKKILLLLALAAFTGNAQAQKCKAKDVPAPVRNAFQTAYPDIKKTYWGKDSVNYQVAFFTGKAPISVTYDITGKRIITERQMPVEDLPKGIIEYVQKNYPGKIFLEAAQITDAEGVVTYETQVKDLALIFDNKGNFIESLKCY